MRPVSLGRAVPQHDPSSLQSHRTSNISSPSTFLPLKGPLILLGVKGHSNPLRFSSQPPSPLTLFLPRERGHTGGRQLMWVVESSLTGWTNTAGHIPQTAFKGSRRKVIYVSSSFLPLTFPWSGWSSPDLSILSYIFSLLIFSVF